MDRSQVPTSVLVDHRCVLDREGSDDCLASEASGQSEYGSIVRASARIEFTATNRRIGVTSDMYRVHHSMRFSNSLCLGSVMNLVRAGTMAIASSSSLVVVNICVPYPAGQNYNSVQKVAFVLSCSALIYAELLFVLSVHANFKQAVRSALCSRAGSCAHLVVKTAVDSSRHLPVGTASSPTKSLARFVSGH